MYWLETFIVSMLANIVAHYLFQWLDDQKGGNR